MAYYHFLIDLSQSNHDFQQQLIFQRLLDQIDHLIELNQHQTSQDRMGFTFFAQGILRREIEIPFKEFRALVSKPLSYQPGSAILDAIAKTTSFVEENLKEEVPLEKNLLIFSDFEENASNFYTVESLGEIIKEFSKRWEWGFYAFGIKNSQTALLIQMNFNLENLIILPT